MTRIAIGLLCAALAGAATADNMQAKGRREHGFRRIGTFANYRNNPNIADETVSEIIAATADGRTLICTDSPRGEVGLIDIRNPATPLAAGKIALDPNPADEVDYRPTSVDVLGNTYALVAASTGQSVFDPGGSLLLIHIPTRTIVSEIDLGGQPDSIQISPDRRFVAVAIENERSETLCVGGSENGLDVVDGDDHVPGTNTTEDLCEDGLGVVGGLPQTPFGNPPGYLVVIRITGPNPAAWTRHDVDLTGLAEHAPDDPEPEFVDINRHNHAVVTLQENNHVVVVDLARHEVINHFPAGTSSLDGVDATEDGVIALTDTLTDVPREPDAVAWIPGWRGRPRIATVNEGDLFGGSRGFSIFTPEGALTFDSGSWLEELAVRHGHYPESRSENKGTEPEAIEYARFGSREYLFVGSERGSFIAVYEIDRFGRPAFVQMLPGPLGPEGLLAIPHRNLLVASGETDDPPLGVRSTVMIYQLTREAPDYPQIVSGGSAGAPLPWSALSGMTSIPGRPDTLLAVEDSYYSESRILAVDVSRKPAVITGALTIRGGSGNYDAEGIAIAPDGTLWIASEGNDSDSRQNRLVQTSVTGDVLAEVALPAEILACRAASTSRETLGSGFEGVAILRGQGGTYRLLLAQQRGWDYTTAECEDLDDDAGGLNDAGEPNRTRLWIYDPQRGTWDHIAWELAPKPANASWVGLSEITETPTGEYLLIERDNRTGDFAELKTLAKTDLSMMADRLVSHTEKAVYDLLPHLTATNGWITDKPEGVAVTSDGHTYLVTDNDGVEDWSGETWFLGLGRYWRLFR